MRCLFPACLIVLVAGGAAEPAAAAPQAAALQHAIAAFQPHRASYELTLERARSSDVSAASGRLSFEWGDTCDGWTVRQLTRMEVARGQQPSLDFGWRFDSWEAKDGTSYRFFIDRFDHGRKSESVSGRASLEAVGKAGSAHFEQPVERDVSLPAGTIFPTWHSFEMLAMPEAGQQQIWRTVFDGSADDDGLSEASAVLADGKLPATVPEAGAKLLDGVGAHRVFLAYYSTDPTQSEPIHEQEVLIYANGIADDFVFDYGDFALRARLVELEALPKPKC